MALNPNDFAELDTYRAEIEAWRQAQEEELRAETGWLTLTGLYWLNEGENTLGSDPACAIGLPESAPARIGFIDFRDHSAVLHSTTETAVSIDGVLVKDAALRDDHDPLGATKVELGTVSFNIIRRGDQYGVRVRDRNNPVRLNFTGRTWFPVDPTYRVTAIFTPYDQMRQFDVTTIAAVDIPMESPGYVDFVLSNHQVRLEAFSADDHELWFVFRDTGKQIYRAARFLDAPLNADGTVILDFNRAYNPPCAFTPYATCPLPPKGNSLSFPIEAGEKTR